MLGTALVTGIAQTSTAVLLVVGDGSGVATAIAVAVVTSIIGAVGSIIGAVLARGQRHHDEQQDELLHELEKLVSAPRRIGARVGDNDPILQPPDNEAK